MKLAVIGAGNVGASCAQCAVAAGIDEIVLLDVMPGVPQGKALDLQQSGALGGYCGHVKGTNDYADIGSADVVVVTAGFARKPGMSRDDLVAANAKVIREVSVRVKETAPDTVLIMVTNPLDAMAYVAMKETGFPRERVLGMAGVLDSARLRTFIAMELDVSAKDVSAMVLGGHGDSMVPLLRLATVGGVPVTSMVGKERLEAIVTRTRNGGGEIVKLLGTGSAYYAPGASAFQMAEAALKGKPTLIPASVWCQGEYGLRDVFVGVPVLIGKGGLLKIVETELRPEEQAALTRSAEEVRGIIAEL